MSNDNQNIFDIINLSSLFYKDESRTEDDLDKYESEHCTVRFQSRMKKDYGPKFNADEALLKSTKKLLDDLGDYEVVSVETSLVYAAPKTPSVPSF